MGQYIDSLRVVNRDTGKAAAEFHQPAGSTQPAVAIGGDAAITGALTVGGAAITATPSVLKPWQFDVEAAAYGAKGDGTTDDTAAINLAVTAAVNYAKANNGYAEVVFGAKTYLIAGNPTTGGSTNGSAQIPLPVIAETANKVTLVLRGTRAADALYHWHQTTVQRNGTVLKTTYNAGNSLPATGEVSVIGGPTPHYMSDPPTVWNNMLVVIDGITIVCPANPNVCGFDFRDMAEARVINAAVLTDSTSGAPPIPPANWSFGLAMPVANNNALCDIGSFSCEGQVYGLWIYEHVQADSIRIINCFDGIVCWSSSGFPHANIISYACVEGCARTLVFAGGLNKLEIPCLDVEWGAQHMILDVGASGSSTGTIAIGSNGGDGSSLNAALLDATTGYSSSTTKGLRVINRDQATGHVTAPSVPATTVALLNPFFRDAAIQVNGGTVTAIAIDGTATGLTSGTVFLPTCKTITLTYSAAPTWNWVLL